MRLILLIATLLAFPLTVLAQDSGCSGDPALGFECERYINPQNARYTLVAYIIRTPLDVVPVIDVKSSDENANVIPIMQWRYDDQNYVTMLAAAIGLGAIHTGITDGWSQVLTSDAQTMQEAMKAMSRGIGNLQNLDMSPTKSPGQ